MKTHYIIIKQQSAAIQWRHPSSDVVAHSLARSIRVPLCTTAAVGRRRKGSKADLVDVVVSKTFLLLLLTAAAADFSVQYIGFFFLSYAVDTSAHDDESTMNELLLMDARVVLHVVAPFSIENPES